MSAAPVLDTPDVGAPPPGVPEDLWGLRGLVEDLSTLERPLSPEDVETGLRLLQLRIQRSAAVVARLNDEHKAAYRVQLQEEAAGYLEHDGPHSACRQAGIQRSMPAREAADIAKVKLTYARDLAAALEVEVRCLQSIGAWLRETYRLPQGGH